MTKHSHARYTLSDLLLGTAEPPSLGGAKRRLADLVLVRINQVESGRLYNAAQMVLKHLVIAIKATGELVLCLLSTLFDFLNNSFLFVRRKRGK